MNKLQVWWGVVYLYRLNVPPTNYLLIRKGKRVALQWGRLANTTSIRWSEWTREVRNGDPGPPDRSQHPFKIPAKDARSESTRKETSDKPKLRVGLQIPGLDSARVARSWKSRTEGRTGPDRRTWPRMWHGTLTLLVPLVKWLSVRPS